MSRVLAGDLSDQAHAWLVVEFQLRSSNVSMQVLWEGAEVYSSYGIRYVDVIMFVIYVLNLLPIRFTQWKVLLH